jgi:phosphoglycerate dehydrogenase-like enzyme
MLFNRINGRLGAIAAHIQSSPPLSRFLTTSSNYKSQTRVAILDDYLSLSKDHFEHVPKVALETFTDALPTWTHPLTTSAEKKEIVNRLKDFPVIVSMRERTPFPGELLRSLPNLKVLLVTGSQFQTFDLETAKEMGIVVATAPGKGRTDRPHKPPTTRDIKKGGAHSTTQHTWALILALARNVALDDRTIKSGGWQSDLATGLLGKTLGVVGLGRLGAAAARIGSLAWGMKIICWSENLTQEKADKAAEEADLPPGTFQHVSKETLFKTADVVSTHYVLSPRSVGIIDHASLFSMKPTALFVNTSRAGLLDEPALLQLLREKRIKGAALDVFDREPLPRDSPWRWPDWGVDGKTSHLLTTPHMGYVEDEIMNAWYGEQAENLERWVEGKELLHRIV